MAIQLKLSTFARAAEKARAVRPRVVHVGATYGVARSDGGVAVVRFVARPGGLWAACSCPAGSPAPGSRRGPAPCYHIAAAVLAGRAGWSAPAPPAPSPGRALRSRGAVSSAARARNIAALNSGRVRAAMFAPAAAPTPAPAASPVPAGRPGPPHSHACPHCHDLYPCAAPGCAEIDDAICNACDAQEIAEMDWRLSL